MSEATTTPVPAPRVRVLCVDDEPRVLDALGRLLRTRYDVVVAAGGAAGLEALATEEPFAVVVSDMRMPGMDGAAFLKEVRLRAPAATRVLLTGHADLDAAIAAVNEASVFRFLCKPCSPEVFYTALEAAVEQHRLVTAERELLEETLHGSIRALTQLLALASPTAFGRAARAKQLAGALAARLAVPEPWSIEVAAMLSQIGAITLPSVTAEKLYYGHPLDAAEQVMVERMPMVALELLQTIPRLEAVRAIVHAQTRRYDGTGNPANGGRGDGIPVGARILKVVLDFDGLEVGGMSTETALATLRGREGWYDPAIVAALTDEIGATAGTLLLYELTLHELRPGMVLTDDVLSGAGLLLVARGQEVTFGLLERLQNFSDHVGVQEPIRVRPSA